MSKKIKHIAVMRLSAMGDVAMIVPVLRAFSSQFPDVKINVISRPFFKAFFNDIPNLDFFAFDKKKYDSFFGLFRLFFDLKKLNIDAFLDLHNVMRSKILRNLFALSGKKIAFTKKARSQKKALTRPENKVFKPLKTIIQRHLETFSKLGFDVDLSIPNFLEKADLTPEIISLSGKKENQWIGIAPFAQYDSKVYPQDLMQQVINNLAEDKNIKIFLFGGGEKEIQLLNDFKNNFENIIVVAGKLNLEQEIKLISNLDVMLAMDSGNAHIAAITGVPTITLWGATHPFAGFSPFAQPLENALVSDRNLYPKLPTSVYGNKIVDGYQDAMRTISIDKVVSKIQSILTDKN